MAKIKVLMFGWEFPPFNSGGLGVACEGLTKALTKEGLEVIFVLPKKMDCKSHFCKIVFASDLKAPSPKMFISSYVSSVSYSKFLEGLGISGLYCSNLFEEVARYAQAAEKIVLSEKFDIIHAHDWLSFPAGLAAKKISQKPLVIHIHATEFDRTGGLSLNPSVYELEKKGFLEADAVIAVSNFTKEKIVRHYGINPEKIRVVHNAISSEFACLPSLADLPRGFMAGAQIVLFLGRLTLQKGPDYFLLAAKKVLERKPNVFFVMTGSGDMERQLIEQAVDLGISDKVIFTGFLRGEDLTKIYKMADLYVLSSVSEPFGLTALEALQKGTPVLISKQSGVSEILNHCLKVDFWDIVQMANKILAVLNYPELHQALQENGSREVQKFSWQDSAKKCIAIYSEILNSKS